MFTSLDKVWGFFRTRSDVFCPLLEDYLSQASPAVQHELCQLAWEVGKVTDALRDRIRELDRFDQAAYDDGSRAGYEEGNSVGYRQGHAAGVAEAEAQLARKARELETQIAKAREEGFQEGKEEAIGIAMRLVGRP